MAVEVSLLRVEDFSDEGSWSAEKLTAAVRRNKGKKEGRGFACACSFFLGSDHPPTQWMLASDSDVIAAPMLLNTARCYSAAVSLPFLGLGPTSTSK
jgi:hypothetical protein